MLTDKPQIGLCLTTTCREVKEIDNFTVAVPGIYHCVQIHENKRDLHTFYILLNKAENLYHGIII